LIQVNPVQLHRHFQLAFVVSMAAVVKTQCGEKDCLCTFLLFDMDLAQEWLKSFRQFLDASKTSLRSIKPKALFMPWTLHSLAEHEECFQQWCVLQLLIGTVATVAVFMLYIIWNATSDLAIKLPIGTIIIDALLRFTMAFLATWIIWFGVIVKHGCCCAIACCCLAKPNLLAVAIVEGLFAVLTAISLIQALNHGHVLLILAAVIVFTHFVAQVYLAAEAFVIWLKNREAPTTSSQETVVGPPVILGQKASISEKQGAAANGDASKGQVQENQESPV
jgi:hypothetical protein